MAETPIQKAIEELEILADQKEEQVKKIKECIGTLKKLFGEQTSKTTKVVPHSESSNTTRKGPKSASKYKGVSPSTDGKKWRAQIWLRGEVHYIGTYNTEEEAHEAYEQAKADAQEQMENNPDRTK